jgi:hypothetical protein
MMTATMTGIRRATLAASPAVRKRMRRMIDEGSINTAVEVAASEGITRRIPTKRMTGRDEREAEAAPVVEVVVVTVAVVVVIVPIIIVTAAETNGAARKGANEEMTMIIAMMGVVIEVAAVGVALAVVVAAARCHQLQPPQRRSRKRMAYHSPLVVISEVVAWKLPPLQLLRCYFLAQWRITSTGSLRRSVLCTLNPVRSLLISLYRRRR